MPYQPLTETRLKTELPLILAGPMLRKATRDSVTVWVALQERCDNITLTLTERVSGTAVLSGHASSWQIGDRLHVAAVTARKERALSPEKLYTYDLSFGGTSLGDASSLKKPRVFNKDGAIGHKSSKPLCYENFELPSFLLAPDDWRQLRFLNASCSKLRGEGSDASLAIDRAIAEHAEAEKSPSPETSALVRPHLLALTGDQVYCDDVPGAALRLIIDAGKVIFGNTKYGEDIPLADLPSDASKRVKEIERKTRPRVRLEIAKYECHFTSDDDRMENHLLYFSEYVLMYLMSWSDVLWPTQIQDFPSFKDTYKDSYFEHPAARSRYQSGHLRPCFSTLKVLPYIRRALANIPTYMSMDDHELADDSFISANWCARVLGSPLGRQVIRNGLKAYALFQAWGNTPEQFESDCPGEILLDLISQGKSADSAQVDKCLALPPQDRIFEPNIWDGKLNGKSWDGKGSKEKELPNMTPLMKPYISKGGVALFHDPTASPLVWHYYLNFGNYRLIVNDTRTWRSYPGDAQNLNSNIHGFLPCIPIGNAGLEKQFPKEGSSGSGNAEVLFVVNGLAPFDVPFLEWLREYEKFTVNSAIGKGIFDIDIEGWSTYPEARERYFAFLATGDLKTKSPTERRIVILSGDIHHSYSCRMQYYAEKPLFGSSVPHSAVFALLTSSALKNEDGNTRKLHDYGYDVINGLKFADNRPMRKFFFGWKEKKSMPNSLGTLTVGENSQTIVLSVADIKREPLVVCLEDLGADYQDINEGIFSQGNLYQLALSSPEPSDWRYRLDYFSSATRDVVKPEAIAAPGKSSMAKAAEEYKKRTMKYGPKGGLGAQIVGKNNMGNIYFDTVTKDGEQKHNIVQGLWWYADDGDEGTLKEHAYHVIPFDPTPGKFPVKSRFGPASPGEIE